MRITLTAVAAALAMQFTPAQAQSIVGLVGDDVMTTIDAKSGKAAGLKKIEGVGPILGIDVRPADGMLYALAADGTVATIDPATGVATPKSKLDTMPPAGASVTVDFNPVADRMRIIGSDGTNLRANVDDGKVTTDKPLNFAATDAANGQTPMIVAGAYSNSVKGAKETTLYDIDGQIGGLFRQAPPNDGILNTIGMLGVTGGKMAFDILADASGASTGMLIANGSLYTVDLGTGKADGAKKIAGLPSGVRDIAVMPAPAQKGAEADMMKTEQTAGYLPKPAAGDMKPADGPMMGGDKPKAMTMQPASMQPGDMRAMDKKPVRTDASVKRGSDYAGQKTVSRKGPQCNEKTAQY